MPGKIKVKVLAGRNLPVMDRASDTTDAFVEIKFGSVTHKTDVCRKSLNPHWNSTEWYRFEVDESELQDEPLQLRLMDHDTYSANDAIGKVVISLAPLLAREAHNVKGAAPHGGAVLSGWIPVFDTMHGIRGELNVIVKVELFSDFNKYKTSSCGVQFFHCPMIPPGYKATSIHGFVEELVVNDDPEYQWIDKIRTPRASNEARQVAFIKLSNQVQRLVGLKAAELGANAVVGYQQDFDLEGEAGVVARAIGTAVSITPLPTPSHPINIPPCTQQQLRKYLDILTTDSESITDLNAYFQTHPQELERLLNILNPRTPSLNDETDNADDDDNNVEITRQASIQSYAGSVFLYPDDYTSQNSLKHIADDQTDLNKLLNRSDEGDSDPSSSRVKIKKFKSNFLLKRLSSLRSRRTEKQDDQISIKSNSSDTSRISISDIKKEFSRLTKLKKPKFRKVFTNMEDEGVGMASILARSVIHAHTSLACIAETHDSEHSPNSTLRQTSESEHTNKSDDDKIKKSSADLQDSKSNQTDKKVPVLIFSSLSNINAEDTDAEEPKRKISGSCPSSPIVARSGSLLTPAGTGFRDSVSSVLSGESSDIYSSSEEEDESSDLKTDTEKSIETTSSVVQSVLSHEVNPAFIAQMERKLSILDTASSYQSSNEDHVNPEDDLMDIKHKYELDNTNNDNSRDIVEPLQNKPFAPPTTDPDMCVISKPNTHHHFKFHNPFSHKKSKSISAPSSPVESHSFVYRSSMRIKSQFAKFSNSSMMKSLSHYSLPKKKNIEKKVLSQPNSSSDIGSKTPSDTVLGSPFLSYADLLSLDKEGYDKKSFHRSDEIKRPKVSMYIGSEPVSRASLSGSLYPDHGREEHQIQGRHLMKKDKAGLKSSGLVHTAMETILMDRVQSLLVPSSPDPLPIDKQFFEDVNQKLEKVEESRIKAERVNSATETPHLDKVHSLIPSTSDSISPEKMCCGLDKADSENNNFKMTGLTHSVGVTQSQEEHKNNNSTMDTINADHVIEKEIEKMGSEATNLTQTAMETILIDKFKTLIGNEININIKQEQLTDDANVSERKESIANQPTGLIRNAVETILMDKVQTLINPSDIDSNQTRKDIELDSEQLAEVHKKNDSKKSFSLVNSAMETMLLEKMQSLLPVEQEETKQQVSIKAEDTVLSEDATTSHKDKKTLVRQDSIDSATETCKMSKGNDEETIPSVVTKPVLQHFHPILSGAPLETIPSLPENSFDHTESLDVEGVECETMCKCLECETSDTNSASVCDNSHAACRVDRSERDRDKGDKDKGSPRHARHESYGDRDPVPPAPSVQNSSLNASSTPMGIHRRSSDSDLSVTPKGGSLNTSVVNVGSGGGAILRPSMNSNNLEMLEYPFLTMTEFPPGFIVHIGGTVCARSVKLVDGGGESAARAAWWAELRTELRAHARALRCNAVIAYADTAAICEDVCVLSASGTAAVINLDCDFNSEVDTPVTVGGAKGALEEPEADACGVAHVPYSPGTGPYRAELSPCGGCRRARVPAVLLATCAKPNRLAAYPKAVTLTAVAARIRRAPPTGEPAARDISDQLPFLEYELHKLLLAKLRMQGANAVFSLQTRVSVGERCVVALASGAAVRLAALPPPKPPRIKASENDKEALEIQKALWESFTANKAANGYDVGVPELGTNGALPEAEDEEAPVLDLCADKDACVLELDEAEDVETARNLAIRRIHTRMQVFTNGLKAMPGALPQAFAQVWRARLSMGGGAGGAAERHVGRALDGVAYKLRRLQPCALAHAFQLELPEDEIQLIVSGAAIPLIDPNKPENANGLTENGHVTTSGNHSHGHGNHSNGTGDADDDIFALDEEQLVKSPPAETLEEKNMSNGQSPTTVSLTSLSFVCGARVTLRICALRLLFVRETTAVRELGGLSGFLHTFTCEVLAIVRAYTAALGGNALTSFYITQLMLQDNAHKNQGQCLLSVGGDVVHVMY